MIIWTRSREILSVGPAVFHLRYSRDTETSASRAQDPGPPICTMGNRRYMAHAGAIFGPPGPQKLPMKSRRRGSPTSPAISGIAPFITIPPDLPEFGENGPTCGGCVKYGNLRILGQSHRIFRKSRRLPCESRKLHRRPVVVSLRCLREFPRSPNIIRKPPPPPSRAGRVEYGTPHMVFRKSRDAPCESKNLPHRPNAAGLRRSL